MEIITAKTAGFCFGVSRGMELTLEAVKDKEIYTYGPLIHNSEVVKDLDSKGAHMLESLEDINLCDKTVVIRSHGVPHNVIMELENKKANIIDATCPFVSKIHKIVENDSLKGNEIIIIGNPDHPEIIGIKGWSKTKAYVLENTEDAALLDIDKTKPISVVVQTTFKKNKFNQIVDILTAKGYNINVYDTICHATKNRQDEAFEIADKVDVMLVIGDKKSSNTLKLYEICSKQCSSAYHIETVKDLNDDWFIGVLKVGITAGASTPNNIIEEVQNYVGSKF